MEGEYEKEEENKKKGMMGMSFDERNRQGSGRSVEEREWLDRKMRKEKEEGREGERNVEVTPGGEICGHVTHQRVT